MSSTDPNIHPPSSGVPFRPAGRGRLVAVTGAAGGSQGATGRSVVQMLRAAHVPVRALVHRRDARSLALEASGAEVRVCDLLRPGDAMAALEDVTEAYFTYPVTDGHMRAAVLFAQAAKARGLRSVVSMGHLHSRADSPSHRTREHWLVERLFETAVPGSVHLRGAIFYSNVMALASRMAGGAGLPGLIERLTGAARLLIPAGDGRAPLPLIAGSDAARAAATVLLDPTPHLGETYHLCGDIVSLRQASDLLSRGRARPVRYTQVTEWAFRAILQRELDDAHLVAHLTMLWGRILGRLAASEWELVQTNAGGERRLLENTRALIGGSPRTAADELMLSDAPSGTP